MTEQRKRGRKPIYPSSGEERFNLRVSQEWKSKIEKEAEAEGISPSEYIRRRVDSGVSASSPKELMREVLREEFAAMGVRSASEISGINPLQAAARIVLSNAALDQEDGITVFSLDAVPCGPWREALNDATPLALPRQLAEIVGAQPGDLLVPTDGQSMKEAGVPDKGRVIMRPLKGRRPQLGEIVLCCIERENGVWESTIKHWFETPSGAPLLKNGRLQEHPIPPDAVEVHPVAVLVGIMGRATFGTAKGLPTEAREKRRFRRADDDPLSE